MPFVGGRCRVVRCDAAGPSGQGPLSLAGLSWSTDLQPR